MIGNFYTFRALALSLSPVLKGKTINSIFSQEKDELVMEFGTPVTRFVVSCRQGENVCFLQPDFARARRNSANILASCWQDTVESVTLHPSDRILSLHLAGGSSLVFLPFTGRSNVLLVDSRGTITDAFRNGRSLRGTTFDAPPGELLFDLQRILSRGDSNAGDGILPSLRKICPVLGRTLSLEILFRAGIPETASFHELPPSGPDRLADSFLELLAELDRPAPRVYLDETRAPLTFSLVELRHLGAFQVESFADIHAALRFFVYRRRSGSALQERRDALIQSLSRSAERTRRSIAAIEEDLRAHHRAGTYQQYGSLLLTHLPSAPAGASVATVTADGDPVVIPLDARFSAVANAQRYFEKAKRARRAADEAEARVLTLKKRLLRAERLLDALQRASTRQSLEAIMKDQDTELDVFGLGSRARDREDLPFRVFTVDGGFQVLAGKSSQNNDLLTLHHAKPHDLWFHARGAGGSHVVLRVRSAAGPPGKKAREEAAAIAAYYSKMKNARVVPVAMTEKKYVRKPKGAPPGTVVLQREEVLFVAPRLPAGHERRNS